MRTNREPLSRVLRRTLVCIMSVCVMGCGGNDPDKPEPPEPDPGSGDGGHQVVVLNQQERPSVSEVRPDGTVVFAGTGMSDKLKPGMVICSEPSENAPRGFLYKVKSVSTQNGTTVVTTEQACLEDAIETCHVSESFDLGDRIESIEFGDGTIARPMPANETRLEVNAGVKLPFKIKVKGDKVYFRSSPEDLEIIETDPNDEDLEVIEYVGDDIKGTASIAAEIAVPRLSDLVDRLRAFGESLFRALRSRGEGLAQTADHLSDRLANALRLYGERTGRWLERAAVKLEAYSPYGVLERGSSLTTAEDGSVVTDASRLKKGDVVNTRFARGVARSRVECHADGGNL